MMKTLSEIERAAALVRQGALVAFPTETVYGLGGNALLDAAVAKIYAAKARPQFNPLIVHVHSLEQAQRYVALNDDARALAAAFWPGPLTMVLPRHGECALSLLVSAGLDCVGIRMPAHPLARALLKQADVPVAAPSANRSGRISPTRAEHVREELNDGDVAMILDGGACEVGIESTVVSLTGAMPVVLRPGSITLEQLQAVAPATVFAKGTEAISAPGMLASHYAPSKALRLNAVAVEPHEALLAFGPEVPAGAAQVENLSVLGNLQEAAANLFQMLRRLDAGKAARIAAMPVPNEGLGVAINDRLKRAAAPK